MLAREHYVYAHRRATDGRIFYIGKGKGGRAQSASGRNPHWCNIVAKHGFTSEVVKGDLPEPCALALERIVIAKIGRQNLANLVDGGGGITGWRHSEEARKRIGAFHKGRVMTEKMRAALERARQTMIFTPEHRRKMSVAKKGIPRGKLSDETRAKIAAQHTGMKASAEARHNMSLAHIGKHRGRDNATYDHTIRRFIHPELGTYEGTRGDFILKYTLANGDVSAVIHGRQKSVRKWRLA